MPHSGNSADVWILNTALLPSTITMKSAPFAVAGAHAWETYRIADVTAPSKSPLTPVMMPALGLPSFSYFLDGHTYVADSSLLSTTLWDTTADPPAAAIATNASRRNS